MMINIVCHSRSAVTRQLSTRNFHQSSSLFRKVDRALDDTWRAANRLTKHANAFGPLTNMADFSFKDGRPAPFGVKQMIRINKNREYLTLMKKLTSQIDHAVEKHAKLQKEAALEKQRILDSKLKPKGHELL